MFNFFKKSKIKVISKYSNHKTIRDLILKILDREKDSGYGTEKYEDNNLKIVYSKIFRNASTEITYLVYVKNNKELIEVFNRVVSGDGPEDVNVNTFVIGDWIYNLYLISEKKIKIEDLVNVENNTTLTKIENDTRFKNIV